MIRKNTIFLKGITGKSFYFCNKNSCTNVTIRVHKHEYVTELWKDFNTFDVCSMLSLSYEEFFVKHFYIDSELLSS